MKIVFFVDDASNQIDNILQRSIIDKLSKKMHDHQIEIIDPVEIGKRKAIQKILDQDYDLIITYNKNGTELVSTINGKMYNVFQRIRKKHIAWLTEHPLTFYKEYLNSQSNRHYILPSTSHSLFCETMGLNGSYSVEMFGSEVITREIPTHDQREYDVCVAAQWRGLPEENISCINFNYISKSFINDVIDLQATIDNRDTYTAYLTVAKFYSYDYDFIKNTFDIIKTLYWYERKKERISLVKNLAD
jgi:hypothetical protein